MQGPGLFPGPAYSSPRAGLAADRRGPRRWPAVGRVPGQRRPPPNGRPRPARMRAARSWRTSPFI